MNSDTFTLGIIRETREDESRTPLVPNHVTKIKEKYNHVNILVQPSKNRCFSDLEYKNAGAIIQEDLNECNIILGVKEIGTNLLNENKTYLFFSHTSKIQSDNSSSTQGTPGMDKKELIKTILEKDITLIDYENIRDKYGARYLGFGRFAGIVGCYNSLSLYKKFIKKINMKRAFELKNYESLIKEIGNNKFSEIKILVTGDGRVAKGVLELLQKTNIIEISKEEYLNKKFSYPVFCNLKTEDYVKSNSKNTFNLQHFIEFPNDYKSKAHEYLLSTNVLISAHYWDPHSPKIFELKNLNKYLNLQVIGDITCDLNGSIPTTLKSTTIKDPYFYYNKKELSECSQTEESIAVMAVDNLPSELPRDSSTEFGDGVLNEVLPFIIGKDDGRIYNATIIKKGKFLSRYSYIEKYIKK